ncbi:hypothetical protein PUNSTDRAFT_45322 [Punctularia strigosozonata HHB-11173 SS5]|uniref:uncharacterized protein n=1 Tax=Punctularia strigosozonata (strain HHB-11173) TaxID=741275 RepID=UPI0004417648|nr:uncharacterized protein PUNSTDRAFT_45322 [Punctularia strigosozonata HHB-11173 SS5]EIN07854.1 hypothetical protein PUNSTDRAFT_45322 [Punctularia strigosozonata HHB-11173 SS5]
MDLSITVWMDSSLWGDEDTSKMDALQEGLFVGIVRVRSLSLHVPMEEDARWFNQVIGLLGGDALSDLKSVEIDGFLSSRSESGDGAVALDMFSTLSPRLEKLTVCCLWCRWPSSPFEKLAVLEVDWFTRVQGADEWRNLSHCQNLQEMCLHFQEERDQIQHVYADVKFPLLRKLVIHSTENAANSMVGANLFERINCPSLRTLHFYSTKGYYRPFMLAITKSKRTYATVESLRIDWDFPCTDLMTHFPALDKLIIAPGRKAEDIRSRPTGCDSILNNRVQGALGSWPRCRVLDLREIACWYPSSYRCVYNELTKKRNVGRPKITLILPPWGPKRCMEHGLWEQLVQKTRVTSSDLKYH